VGSALLLWQGFCWSLGDGFAGVSVGGGGVVGWEMGDGRWEMGDGK